MFNSIYFRNQGSIINTVLKVHQKLFFNKQRIKHIEYEQICNKKYFNPIE